MPHSRSSATWSNVTSSRRSARPPPRNETSKASRLAFRDRAAVPRPEPKPALPARSIGRAERGLELFAVRYGLDREEPLNMVEQVADAFFAKPPRDAMGRQDGQLLLGRLEEQHHE